jgi:hypothetical protein
MKGKPSKNNHRTHPLWCMVDWLTQVHETLDALYENPKNCIPRGVCVPYTLFGNLMTTLNDVRFALRGKAMSIEEEGN